ncbi:MAG: hypothetical protein OXI43_13880 [Candidatus Poribacteria bacterium]|nr:hypothetical protein [Candidatus Poribacteria bacterium]
MKYKAGQKVVISKQLQGYISAVFADGTMDVAVLDGKCKPKSITYQIGADEVRIAPTQVPNLVDITPLGLIRGTLYLRQGIIAITVKDQEGYAGLWLSHERMEYLEGRVNLTFHHWCGLDDFDEVLEIFDLSQEQGFIKFKGLKHYPIPEDCSVEVRFQGDKSETWGAAVDGEGNIISVLTTDGREIHSLARFRDTGIIEATLISRYYIKDF